MISSKKNCEQVSLLEQKMKGKGNQKSKKMPHQFTNLQKFNLKNELNS